MDGGGDDNSDREEAKRKKDEASYRLIQACKAGDLEAAREPIEDGADAGAQ